MKNVGIVLAAGSSTRMGGTTKKQYRVLLGHPVLFYSLMAFEQSYVNDVVIVCSEGEEDFVMSEIVEKYELRKVHSIIAGASERSGSSFLGIKEAIRLAGREGSNVLIHDAARPLVTPMLINNIIDKLEKGKRRSFPPLHLRIPSGTRGRMGRSQRSTAKRFTWFRRHRDSHPGLSMMPTKNSKMPLQMMPKRY